MCAARRPVQSSGMACFEDVDRKGGHNFSRRVPASLFFFKKGSMNRIYAQMLCSMVSERKFESCVLILIGFFYLLSFPPDMHGFEEPFSSAVR